MNNDEGRPQGAPATSHITYSDLTAGGGQYRNPSETRTSFQDVHVQFVDAFRDARTLDGRQYRELLSIVATIVARLNAAGLDREERPQ